MRALLPFLLLVSARAQEDGPVLIVRTSDKKPYRVAATVAERRLSGLGHRISGMILKDLTADAVSRLHPRAAIAIGSVTISGTSSFAPSVEP